MMSSLESEAQEVLAVKKLGEEMGYGHLMSLASSLWRKALKDQGYPISGAFIPTIDTFITEEERPQLERTTRHYDWIVSKALNQ